MRKTKALVESCFRAQRIASLLLFLIMGSAAQAATSIVTVGGSGLTFDPPLVTIAPGDDVVFVNAGGLHNVVADDGSFRCAHGCDNDGHGGNGAASNSQWVVDRVFSSPGTFGYYCETHGAPGVGMFGTIIVQPAATPSGGGNATVPAMNALFGVALASALVLAAAYVRARRRQR